MSSKHYLSKSLFMKGLQCHKYLYLQKYHPELQNQITEQQEAVFQHGADVGLLAQGLFPGGFTVHYEGLSHAEQIELTRSEMKRGAKTIYEAAFTYNGVFVKTDILHKGNKGWELYEVKSSTKEKEGHLDDIAIQHYVIKGAGIDICKAALVHINTEYVRNGDIEVEKLFVIKDLTDRAIEIQAVTAEKLFAMQAMLDGPMPDIDIGDYCDKPYECAFKSHCWRHIPKNSVFDLREKGIDKFAFYLAGKIRFEDIDPDELNFKQRMQVDAELNNTVTLDREGTRKFLKTLHYPLYFLDFEAFYDEPIPPFDGTRPYMKIPFQYSLHWIEKEGGKLHHKEYLAKTGKDGREDIARQLAESIPDNACVVAYKMSFEQEIIKGLASSFPDYAERLLRINENMIDLMAPFQKRLYYTKEMKGGYSIKVVLPALVPELTYEGMAVSNGGDAVLAYKHLEQTSDPVETKQIRKDLIEYCKLDTLAMVRILERIRECVLEKQYRQKI